MKAARTTHLPESLIEDIESLISKSDRIKGQYRSLYMPMTLDMTRATALSKEVSAWSKHQDVSIYEDAKSRGVPVWDLLEERDPSPRNLAGDIVTELDALGRQLYAAGVNLKQTNVELFYRGQASILMPALINRWLREGQQLAGGAMGLWAFEDEVNAMTVHPFHIEAESAAGQSANTPQNTANRKRFGEVASSGLPVVRIGYRDKDVNLGTYGIDLRIDYKAVKYMPMLQLRLIFIWLGMQLLYDQLDSVYNLIVDGDGSTGAPPSYLQISGGGGAGTLLHADLNAAITKIGVNAMILTHWIGGVNELIDFLNLSQLTGANYRDNPIVKVLNRKNRGPIETDYGMLCPALGGTADKLAFMESMFAVARVVEQGILVETDKIIGQLQEEIAVSETCAYYKFMEDASGFIDYSA